MRNMDICVFIKCRFLCLSLLREHVCVCAFFTCTLASAYCNLHTEHPKKPVCTMNKNGIVFWQPAVSVLLCVRLQVYDVRVVDHLVTMSQGVLGNHNKHFLKVEKEWPCHDWRNRCYSMIYILLSLWFPAQHKDFGFARKCSEEVILAHL